MIVSGGALDLSGATFSAGNVTVSGGTIQNGTFTPGALDAQSGAISANLGGAALALTKTGTGTLVLSGTNTYGGNTLITGGALRLASAGALPGTSNLQLNGGVLDLGAGAPTAFTLGPGAGQVQWLGDGGFGASGADRTVTLNGGAALTWGAGSFVGDGQALLLGSATANILTFANAIDFGTSARTVQVALGSNPATDAILSGTLTGAGSLLKTGPGWLTLSGNNADFAGGVTVSSGAILAGHDSALGTGPVSLAGGSLYTDGAPRTLANALTLSAASAIGGSSTLTLNGAISGTGLLGITTTGTVALNGNNTHSGGTDLYSGTLVVGHNNALGTGTLLLDGGTLRGDGTARTLANAVSLVAASTLAGSSNLTFTDTLTNTSGASLTLTNNNSATTTLAAVNLSSGTTGRTVTFAGTGNLVVSGTVANGSSGASGLTKSGPGTLALNGANTYTGVTTVTGGTLAIATLANAGSDSGIGRSAATATNLVINGGTLRYTGSGDSTNRLFQIGQTTAGGTATLDASGTGALSFTAAGSLAFGSNNQIRNLILTGTNSGANTLTPVFANNGTGVNTLTKNGPGTWVLAGANTYTGATAIADGTLVANKILVSSGNSSLGNATSAVTLGGASTAGTLSYPGSTTNYTRGFTVAAGGGGFEVTTAGQTVTFTTAGVTTAGLFTVGGAGNTAVNTAISSGGALAKTGGGTLTLSAANSYSGGTTINAGTLLLSGSGTLGASTGTVTLAGGTLDLGGLSRAAGVVTFSGGTFANGTLTGTAYDAGSGAQAANAILAGFGIALTKTGTGTLTLAGANTYSGGTAVNAGTLSISANASLGDASGPVSFAGGTLATTASFTATRATTLNAGGATFDTAADTTLTWNGAIGSSTASSLTKIGAGTLILGGVNDYAGDTFVNVGTLRLGLAAALSLNTTLHVANGATFDANGFAQNLAGLSGDGQLDVGTSGVSVAPTGTNVFGGTLSGGGSFTVNGTGTLVLAHANDDFHGEAMLQQGTLKLGAAGALPAGTKVTLATGATLDLDGHGATLGKLEGDGGSVALGTANLTVAQAGNTTFAGAITGAGGLIKDGAGTLLLSGVSDFTGATTIAGGELKVNGSAAHSAFTVSGGILSGTGTVGALTIGAGGILSPGNSPGTLAAGDTLFESHGSLIWEINDTAGAQGADPGWDLLAISGTLAITANSGDRFVLDLTSLTSGNAPGLADHFDPAATYSFTFVTTTAGITGFAADKFAVSAAHFQNPFTGAWSVTSDGFNLTLNYTGTPGAIPEPSTYAALAGLLALAAAVMRKRRFAAP